MDEQRLMPWRKGGSMRKIYVKPVLVKRERLSQVTAQVVPSSKS